MPFVSGYALDRSCALLGLDAWMIFSRKLVPRFSVVAM
jgi:hypothetical protein